MKEFVKMNILVLSDLIGKKYNLFGLASAAMSFMVDLFANNTIGSMVAVFISLGIGIFSVLKARESWLKERDDRRRDKVLQDALVQKKLLELQVA